MASSPKPVGRHRPPLQPPPGTSFNDRVRAIGGMARNAPPPCRFERREPGRWSTGSLLGGSTSKAETDSVLVSIRQTQDHVPGTDQTKPWRCMEHAHQSVHRGHAAERRHPRRRAQDSGRISPLARLPNAISAKLGLAASARQRAAFTPSRLYRRIGIAKRLFPGVRHPHPSGVQPNLHVIIVVPVPPFVCGALRIAFG